MLTNSNGQSKALLTIIAVNFLWGFDFIAIEYMMDYLPATMFTFARLLIGTVVLMAIVFVKYKGLHIKKQDWLRIFIAGGVGMSIYFTVENVGTGMTSASFSSLIMATVPVFGLITDRIFYGNKITVLKVVCVIMSVVGVFLLVAGEPLGVNIKGLLIMLLAAVLWSFYIIYVKPLYAKYNLLTLLTGLFLSGLIVQIPLLLIARPTGIDITSTGIAITIATALLCIIIGELGYVYAIGKLSVTTVSIFENVLPLTAVIFSFIIFRTMLTGIQLVGGIVIMISVTILALRE